ncbi:phosphoribosyltransferase family protein [Candidatus Pacebacteria bacterium]|nr:phosphoribosyltransferase family protein [Candidatus Paceibacterota bacterium]
MSKVLHSLFSYILDFLFPKDKLEMEIENLSSKEIFDRAKLSKPTLSVIPAQAGIHKDHRTSDQTRRVVKIYSIFCYQDSFVKKIIELVKYKGNKKVIDTCGEILYKEIIKKIPETENKINIQSSPLLRGYHFISQDPEINSGRRTEVSNKNTFTIIPIPSSKKRRREKGFNQCELLCESILKNNPNLFNYQNNILKKSVHKISQTKLNKKERLKNLKNSMSISKKTEDYKLIKSKPIILIDDVWTTGATIKEAVRVLEEAGVKRVLVFTLAH